MAVTRRHRWDFPCYGRFPCADMPAPNTPAEPRGASVARFPRDGGLPQFDGGSASAIVVSRPTRRSLAFQPACSLNYPMAALLHRRPQRIRHLLHRSDYYRLERPCRAGIAPAENRRLFTAHVKEQATSVSLATGTPMTFAHRDVIRDSPIFVDHGFAAVPAKIGTVPYRNVHPTRASIQYCAGPGDNSARPETYSERWYCCTARTCPHSRFGARSRQRRSSFAADHYGNRYEP